VLKAFPSREKVKISFDAFTASQFEIFRFIGRNTNAKFKGVPNFLGAEIQKSVLRDLHIIAL